MKIAVIGAGVVGIASAYELALDGHEVSIFEKNAAIAEESSFATTGIIAPSLLHPLSHTQWPKASWRQQTAQKCEIALTRNANWRELRWLWGWKRNPTSALFAKRFTQLHQLVQASQARLHALAAVHGIPYTPAQGQMALVQSELALDALGPKLEALKALDVRFNVLSPEQARALEPGLDAHFPLHAAIQFPGDEVANARQFCHSIKDEAIRLGVVFHFNASVAQLQAGARPSLLVAGSTSAHAFDAIVVCSGGADAIDGIGAARLPLTLVHGHSISLPVRESLHAPTSAVLDCRTGISVVRLGARIRVSGGGELGLRTRQTQSKGTRPLFHLLQTSFPGGASYQSGVQIWHGSSAFTPDALPLVGATSTPGIFLNIGHGHNGWAMACGSARLVTDLIAKKSTDIDATPLQPSRFGL